MIYSTQFKFSRSSLILLSKVKDIKAIISQLELKYQLKGKQQAFCEMIKLILLILFIAHIVACGALHIQKIEIDIENKFWFYQFSNEDWYVKYINAIYWSIVTMVTLGYGDIVPINISEKVYAIGVALVGCFILSYSMNSIGEILKGLAKSNQKFKERMLSLNQYFSKKELNRDLQLKVIKYYQYVLSQEEDSHYEGYNLINQLPTQLKEEIQIKLYQNLLMDKKFFALNFSQQFLNCLSLKMQEEIFAPRQIIYKKGDTPSKFYFLLSGKVDLIIETPDTNKQININTIKKKGQIFGENEYICDILREQSVRSRTVSILAFINKLDFLDVLSQFPLDKVSLKKYIQIDLFYKKKEKYIMIKDQNNLLLSQKNGITCLSCQSFKHTFMECPFIFYQGPKEKIIRNIQRYEIQKQRNYYARNTIKSPKAISIQSYLGQLAYLAQENLLESFCKLLIIISKIILLIINFLAIIYIQLLITKEQLRLSQSDHQINQVYQVNSNVSLNINNLLHANMQTSVGLKNQLQFIESNLKKQEAQYNTSFKNSFQFDTQSQRKQNQQRQGKQQNNSPIKFFNSEDNSFSNLNPSQKEIKSQQKITSVGLIEAEQIINPVLGQECSGTLKFQQNRENNNQIQIGKTRISQRGEGFSLQFDDLNTLNKNGLSISENNLNALDQTLQPYQDENKIYLQQMEKPIPQEFDAMIYSEMIHFKGQEKNSSNNTDFQGPKIEQDHKNQMLNSFLNNQFKTITQKNEFGFNLKIKDDEFEKGQDFQIYFPQNNMRMVLTKQMIIWKKNVTAKNNKKIIKSKRGKLNIDEINSAITGFRKIHTQKRNNRPRNSESFSVHQSEQDSIYSCVSNEESKKPRPSKFMNQYNDLDSNYMFQKESN